MKIRKKLQLLQGITAIRVKAGITQLTLAQYLGISKSLVSMVENNRRSLPAAALLKLSELELQFEQQQGSETPLPVPARTPSATEAFTRSLRESIRRSDLELLRYRLARMEELRAEILASLQWLHCMQPNTAGLPFNMLELEKRKLLKRLERCNETACATIRGKMKMLEIVLESYHTGKDATLTTQAGNKPRIRQWQKPAHAVAWEIIIGNPSDAPGVKLLHENHFLRVQLTA